ncbi:unnamed protein product [Closterium sp. NIES-65]|nr:unnamed protein product [Closterium sp. NIES-65]
MSPSKERAVSRWVEDSLCELEGGELGDGIDSPGKDSSSSSSRRRASGTRRDEYGADGDYDERSSGSGRRVNPRERDGGGGYEGSPRTPPPRSASRGGGRNADEAVTPGRSHLRPVDSAGRPPSRGGPGSLDPSLSGRARSFGRRSSAEGGAELRPRTPSGAELLARPGTAEGRRPRTADVNSAYGRPGVPRSMSTAEAALAGPGGSLKERDRGGDGGRMRTVPRSASEVMPEDLGGGGGGGGGARRAPLRSPSGSLRSNSVSKDYEDERGWSGGGGGHGSQDRPYTSHGCVEYWGRGTWGGGEGKRDRRGEVEEGVGGEERGRETGRRGEGQGDKRGGGGGEEGKAESGRRTGRGGDGEGKRRRGRGGGEGWGIQGGKVLAAVEGLISCQQQDIEDGRKEVACQQDIEDVRREVAVMEMLKGHPSIVNLRNAFEDAQDVHLIMELCEGGELFDRIKLRGKFPEGDAARVIRTVVLVLRHCHGAGIMHRDLKPENILLVSNQSDTDLKVIDWGVATFFQKGKPCTDMAGSPYYLAPEVLAEKYGPEADIWSAGVVLYILLCGLPPFWGTTNDAIFEAIKQATLNLVRPPWPSISDEAKDLVVRMLTRNPKKRITAEEILDHPWIRANTS